MMDVWPIRSDDDHRRALAEIDRLWGAAPGSPEGDRLEVLATLVEDYEERCHDIGAPSPAELLLGWMADTGRSEQDLARALSSADLARALLGRKATVSAASAALIEAAWGLPAKLLVETQRSAA